jgi:pimeloyl-ACP methyl ester carboxylesterase
MTPGAPPRRPPRWEERLGLFLFQAFAPKAGAAGDTTTPGQLAPFEEVEVEQRSGGRLSATFFPALTENARGAVLLLHPWLPYGKAYFHRRGRLAALRDAGYHVLTPDLPSFGQSTKPDHYFDVAIEDALAWLRARAGGLPVHLWGVSAGGHWSHPLLARDREIPAAFFEDVSPHLLEWSWRSAPWGRPFYLFFRAFLRRAYRFGDMRLQAAALRGRRLHYVAGAEDASIPAEDSRRLAAASGSPLLLVPEAGHLGSIKVAQNQIVAAALELFARAEAER